MIWHDMQNLVQYENYIILNLQIDTLDLPSVISNVPDLSWRDMSSSTNIFFIFSFNSSLLLSKLETVFALSSTTFLSWALAFFDCAVSDVGSLFPA